MQTHRRDGILSGDVYMMKLTIMRHRVDGIHRVSAFHMPLGSLTGLNRSTALLQGRLGDDLIAAGTWLHATYNLHHVVRQSIQAIGLRKHLTSP